MLKHTQSIQVNNLRLKDFIKLKYKNLRWDKDKLFISKANFDIILENYNKFKKS